MDLPHLPHQPETESKLREAARRGALPHALILSGPGDNVAAARFAAAAFECTAAENRPCGRCPGCRKVFAGIHPDVITVHDSEHKIMSVDLLRATRQDVYIRPNEGARKVYLFDDCAQLDERCQNILLKVVEEGPPYAAFLFCAENASALLPTLRSRCVELKLRPETQGPPPTQTERAAELCRRMAKKSAPGLTKYLVSLETGRIKREELGALLAEGRDLFALALLTLYGQQCPTELMGIVASLTETLTKTQIMRTIEVLQTYCDECQWNVGPGHVLGALAVDLGAVVA